MNLPQNTVYVRGSEYVILPVYKKYRIASLLYASLILKYTYLLSVLYFYHDILVMTLDSVDAFTVTVTPQSVLWKYNPKICHFVQGQVHVHKICLTK